MLFCTSTPDAGGFQRHNEIFNVKVDAEEVTRRLGTLKKGLELCRWEATQLQPSGLVNVYDFHVAFRKFWNEMTKEEQQAFLDLPDFNPGIFLEITGVDVSGS
jgi:hypothetical protein